MAKEIITKERLEDYNAILRDMKSLLERAKLQAYKAVDNIRVQTYWQIGERIVREELQHKERADYGERLIEKLTIDLDIQKSILYESMQFYKTYSIFHAVRGELSWTHYRELIRVIDKEQRQFYENQIIQNGWSTRELEKQIKANLYNRVKRQGKLVITKPLQLTIRPEDVFKDSYNFEFLGLKGEHNENDFKKGLVEKLEKFLQELGSDFFIGRREVPVLIGGNYDKVDLELFHAGLMCYILVEVKIEHFKHSHVSQMYSYLNWYKENKWGKGQRSPIGLIICKSKDEETVHYALGGLREEIFVSEYRTKLPSEKEIIKRLK